MLNKILQKLPNSKICYIIIIVFLIQGCKTNSKNLQVAQVVRLPVQRASLSESSATLSVNCNVTTNSLQLRFILVNYDKEKQSYSYEHPAEWQRGLDMYTNAAGQHVGSEVVGREGDGMITDADGRRVVAPSDMAYRDIRHAVLWRRGKKHDLGTLPGGKNSDATCINDKVQVVGSSEAADSTSSLPVLWENGKTVRLANVSGVANWINNNGDIVGACSVGSEQQACVWHNGECMFLGNLCRWSTATCINNRGDVVGYASTPQNQTYAFVYRTGKIQKLPLLPGYAESFAYSINNVGDVVGEVIDVYHRQHCAVLWHNGICINLNAFLPAGSHSVYLDTSTFLPTSSTWRLSSAKAINNAGYIRCDGYINHDEHQFVLKPLPMQRKPQTNKPAAKSKYVPAVTLNR